MRARAELRGSGAHATVLPVEPLRRHAHHAEDTCAFSSAMPIGAATGHKREMVDERGNPRDVFSGVAGMPNFDAVHALRDETGDALART